MVEKLKRKPRKSRKCICTLCGKSFDGVASNAKYCSSCKKKNCVVCGKAFVAKRAISIQTCSKACGYTLGGSKRVGTRPSYVGEKISNSLRRSYLENPEFWKKHYARHSYRMTHQNPASRKDVQARIRRTKEERGTLHKPFIVHGGNGRGLTVPQALLHSLVGGECKFVS